MSKIIVVDTIMGGCKTSWAIDYMNKNVEENILYVSPFLDQDDRIVEACAHTREFKKPINKGNGKLKAKDLYALSEMLQWIWRSRIRNGQDINIYIVSKRMRRLLNQWLSGELPE